MPQRFCLRQMNAGVKAQSPPLSTHCRLRNVDRGGKTISFHLRTAAVSPVNARAPLSISYKIAPKLKMSLR